MLSVEARRFGSAFFFGTVLAARLIQRERERVQRGEYRDSGGHVQWLQEKMMAVLVQTRSDSPPKPRGTAAAPAIPSSGSPK